MNRFVYVSLISLALLSGCATSKQVKVYEGPIQTKMQKLEWEVLEEARRFEAFIDQRGAVYEDPALEAYLNEIGKKLAPENLDYDQIRINFKVVRDPTLNAYSMPHGRIYLSSGLLARLENESQLASVMGHEISHVLNRDLIYFVDSVHKKTVTAKIFDLVLTPATALFGVGGIGERSVNLVYIASVTGYGREQELRADIEGFRASVKAGYDPKEALRVYDFFMADEKKYKHPSQATLLSTHPSYEARKEAIEKLMATLSSSTSATSSQPAGRFKELNHNVKIENASLNLTHDRFQHARDNLATLLQENPEDSQAYFYLGECFRLMAKDPRALKDELDTKEWGELEKREETVQRSEWWGKAEEAYQKAISLNKTYADPYRGNGLLYEAQGKDEKALSYLQLYLQEAPDAKDRRYVEAAVKRLIESLPKEVAKHEAKK